MRQQTLFPAPAAAVSPVVPGLLVCLDYIDPGEERRLLEHVDAGAWSEDFRRRIQLFGLGYDETGTRWVRDFPPWLAAFAGRLTDDGCLPRFPDNCVINDYAPGVGIGPHRDFMAFDAPVVAVSLLSDVVIEFSRREQSLSVPVHVPARSLWRASGEARWQWMHGIAGRRSDVVEGERQTRGRRISLTFRVARGGPARPG